MNKQLQSPRISQLARLTPWERALVLSFSDSATSKKRRISNLDEADVAAEVVAEVTDLKPATSVVVAKPAAVAKTAKLSSTTTTSQPYERSEVNSDIKKVTVKCLRHCMSLQCK